MLKNIKQNIDYIKALKTRLLLLQDYKEKNYKNIGKTLNKNYCLHKKNINENFIQYILSITFSRTNTFLHLTTFSGHMLHFYSAGNVNYTGKSKKLRRFWILKDIFKKFIFKFRFLYGKFVGLHLTNVGFFRSVIIKYLKKKYFITSVKVFSRFPHNGCRQKKVRRKKIRTKKQKI